MTTADGRPVIIVGAARSGTNVLRSVLCGFAGFDTWPCDEINYVWRHGNRAAPTDELTPADARPEVVRYVRRAFDRQRARTGAAVVVEKTCATTLRIGFVQQIMPEARYVVIVRDGRDVTVSAMERWTARLHPRYLARKARFVPVTDLPYYGLRYARTRLTRLTNPDRRLSTWGPRFDGLDDAVRERSLAEVCALQWARCVETADRQLRDAVDPELVHSVRYEDLVTMPEKEIAQLAEFLDIANELELPPFSTSSVGRWRAQLTDDDRAAVEAIAGPTLASFGYE